MSTSIHPKIMVTLYAMSSCVNACAPNYTPAQLNTLLIPSSLVNSTNAQRLAFVEGTSAASATFRNQAWKFLGQMSLAKKYRAQGKFFCPVRVPWATTTSPLIVNGTSLALYMDYYACVGNVGFVFMLRSLVTFFRKLRLRKMYLQNGKSFC